MVEKKQLITIKGTRDGLTLFIDDHSAFEDVLVDLKKIVTQNAFKNDDQTISVTVQLGNRYLTSEQKDAMKQILNRQSRIHIQAFESDVILKEEAIKWKDESDVKVINRIIRSGQVCEVNGDLLLIGDVNPGGKVVSTGNVFILGNLRGIAHAGSRGDAKSVIVASYMKPSQLRIADYISRSPDYESSGVYMECGYVDEKHGKIMIERLQALPRLRKDLSGFERRMNHG